MNIICRQKDSISAGANRANVKSLVADEKNLLWIDLNKPTNEELEWLYSVFGFHHLAIEDTAKQSQRPKVEAFDNHFFLVAHAIKPGRRRHFELIELYFFVGPNYLVSIRHEPFKVLDDLIGSASESRYLKRGPDFLLYAILDAAVDTYFPAMDKVDDAIDKLETRILDRPSKEAVAELFGLKQQLVFMRKLVGPQRDVINALTVRDFPNIAPDTVFYFRDIYDHLIRIYDMIDSYRDLISGALDIYLSTVSIHLNEVMKRLTVFATVFMPITFITGVFGMNFGIMPQVQYDSGWLWWLSVVFMGLVAGGNYYWFSKRKWL